MISAVIRYRLCTELAHRMLLDIKPASVYSLSRLELRDKMPYGIIVDSYGHYLESQNISAEPKDSGFLGMTVLFAGKKLILYNEAAHSSARRLNWTLAHEAGHILLGHKGGGKAEEAEADIFAAELLMPSPVIAVLDRLYMRELPPEELTVWFNVSQASAERRRAELKRRGNEVSDRCGELITALFPWLEAGINNISYGKEIYK